MANESDWYPEFEALAEHLGGWPVVIRWRSPPGRNDAGLTSRHRLRFYIDIQPGLDTMYMFKVFLHEVGHVKIGNLYSTDAYLRPSNSEPGVSTHPEYAGDQTEDAADKLADYWLSWAEARSFKYLDPGDPDHVRVKIYAGLLKHYKET